MFLNTDLLFMDNSLKPHILYHFLISLFDYFNSALKVIYSFMSYLKIDEEVII